MDEDTIVSGAETNAGAVETDGGDQGSGEQVETEDEQIERLMAEASDDGSGGGEPKKLGEKREAKPTSKKMSAQPVTATVEELATLARTGKVSELLETLGVNRGQMDPPAKRYAQLKGMVEQVREEKRIAEESVQASRAELEAHESKLAEFAQKLQDEYASVAQAKAAIERGEFAEALKLMSGGKIDPFTFAKKMAEEDMIADPVARRRLAELEAQREEERKQAEENRKRLEALQAQQQQQARAAGERADLQVLAKTISGFEGEGDEYDALRAVVSSPRAEMFLRPVYAAVVKAIQQNQWKPTKEEFAEQVVEFSRRHLLALREDTAILHSSKNNRPAGAQAVDTDRGNRRLRRAAPTPPRKSVAEETDEETLDRVLASLPRG